MPPSSLPERLTLNGAEFCCTVAIGFAGLLMVGGLFAQLFRGLALLRGFGVPDAKSVGLLSVSVQPALARSAAAVLLSVADGPVPSNDDVPVPKPMRSTTVATPVQLL